MSDWSYIIAAYAVSWVVLLGYGAYLTMRARRAREAARDFLPEVTP